jgi:hypothetical protein
MLQAMAKRIGATITEVAASHAVFMTQPKVVADVIDEAARKGSVEARWFGHAPCADISSFKVKNENTARRMDHPAVCFESVSLQRPQTTAGCLVEAVIRQRTARALLRYDQGGRGMSGFRLIRI